MNSVPDNQGFARRLKHARASRGYLRQIQLAEKLGVDRRVVSRWESAYTLPTTDKLLALAELLKISLDWLLRGLGVMNEPPPSGA